MNAVHERILNHLIAVGHSLKPFQNRGHGESYASKCHEIYTIKRKHKSRNVRHAEKHT